MFKQKNSSMRNRIQLVCTSSLLIMLLGITALFRSTSMKIIYQQTRNSMYRSMENMQNDMDAILQRIEYGLLNVYEQREILFQTDLKRKTQWWLYMFTTDITT